MRHSDLRLTQGALSLHVTRDPLKVKTAQALRYRIFCDEMGGKIVNPNLLDADEYDPLCDHMIVYDHSGAEPKVIGTYRFLRQEFVSKVGKFYTQTEFDLNNLLSHYKGSVVEVGRSCIDSAYRTGTVIKLLWRGIAMYLNEFNLDLMFGCASFHGTHIADHLLSLSYLHHFHRIAPSICPTPLEHVKAEFTPINKEEINERRAFAALPPLIKGYLRLGGKVGEGAVIDKDINTIDVCIIVEKKTISQRYFDHLNSSEISDSSSL